MAGTRRSRCPPSLPYLPAGLLHRLLRRRRQLPAAQGVPPAPERQGAGSTQQVHQVSQPAGRCGGRVRRRPRLVDQGRRAAEPGLLQARGGASADRELRAARYWGCALLCAARYWVLPASCRCLLPLPPPLMLLSRCSVRLLPLLLAPCPPPLSQTCTHPARAAAPAAVLCAPQCRLPHALALPLFMHL